jgi:uncharacterized protein (DUF1015 family)
MVALVPVAAAVVEESWAADVIGPAYDALQPHERRQFADANPDSFFNVIRSPLDYEPGPVPEDLVGRNAAALERLLSTGRYQPAGEPTLFAYRLRSVAHSQTAIVGDLAVTAAADGTVLAHEHTRPAKESEIASGLGALGINASPVGLTYRRDDTIDALVAELCDGEPEVDFRSDDGLHHSVWRATDPLLVADLCRAFGQVERTYIVDGHHRVAAAAVLGHRHFLAGLVPDAQLRLLAYHRIIAGPCPATPAAFQAAGAVPLDHPRPPRAAGEAVLYLAGAGWFGLRLDGSGTAGAANVGTTSSTGGAPPLDVRVADHQILGPLGGITDPRTDPRLSFAPGGAGIAHLARRAEEVGGMAVALHPLSVDQLFAEADAGRVLPPKSTWFEPKLRSGLFIVRR